MVRRCVCDLEKLKNEEAMTRVGSQRHSKKKKIKNYIHIVYCIVLLYNKKEYNLMMADIQAETCSY